MDQDSTRDGAPTGEKRNWRDRLGVNKGLPKLSDEFRPRESARGPARDELTASERPTTGPGRAPLAPRSAPVERPAPMAPRIPPRAPGAIAQEKRAEASAPIRPPAPRTQAPEPQAEREVPAMSNRLSPQAGRSATQQPGKFAPASRNPNDEFGERLRAQREAAERLVQQRLAAARQKAQEPAKPASNGDARPIAPASAEDKPRFSFADEEIAAAKRESPAPSAFAPISPPPYVPSNANYVRPMARPAASEQPSRSESFNRPSPSAYVPPRSEPAPFPAARPEPSAYRPAAATAPLGAPEPRPGTRDIEAPRASRAPRRPEVERRTPPRRGAHARELDYIEDDLDEVFEDERPSRRPVNARRAKAADYSAAYRGYDEDYEEDEPRGRSGPIILLLALLAVAAIAGGLIYWYKQQQHAAAPAAESSDVPVVTSPQEPPKVEPEPEQGQQAVPTTPQGRKQIYDRILGEETLEPERIVPTEEQPQQAPAQQLPPANQDPNAQQNQQGTEPLPLPLPPPPGTGEQGRIDNGQEQAASRQVPEPASSNSLDGARKPAAQASDMTETASLPEEADEVDQVPATPRKAEPPATRKATEVPAKPRKQETETARAANDEPQSLQGTGPVQIAPQPLNQQPVQQQAQQPFTFNPAPQALQQQAPAPTQRAPRRGRDEDPLADTRTPFTGTFQSSQPQPAGRIASTDQDQPAVFQQAVQTQPAPQPQQAFQQPAPQQQQQVAVATPQEPAVQGEASGYVVQLASFRSEAEAQGEFQRLAQRHPGLVGNMRSRVVRSDLGAAGTFYRLGVGPMPTKEAASQLCSSLIAAGEKDCLVRRQ